MDRLPALRHNGRGLLEVQMVKRGGVIGVAMLLLCGCSQQYAADERPTPEQMRQALKDLLNERPELAIPEFETSLNESPALNVKGFVRIGSFDCDPESMLFIATFSAPNLTMRQLEGRFELDARSIWRARVIRTQVANARDPYRRPDWYPSQNFSWSDKNGERP